MSLPRIARHLMLLLIVAAAFAGMMAAPAAAHVVAHVIASAAGGWSEGFAHPFSGIDHLAAMVAVGLWASQLGRPALFLLPLMFLGAMALGAAASFAGANLPLADDGVAVSVAMLGVLLAVAARPPLLTSGALVAAFGVMHGASHAAEMPLEAAPFLYGLGFLGATATLHLAGIALGTLTTRPLGRRLLPIGAAAIIGLGVMLVFAW
jgi:urease accessory protein